MTLKDKDKEKDEDLIAKFEQLQRDPLKNKVELDKLLSSIPLRKRIELRKNTVINFPLDLSKIDKNLADYGIVSFKKFTHSDAAEISSSPIMIEAAKASSEKRMLTKEQLDELFHFENKKLADVLSGDSAISAKELDEAGDEVFTNFMFAIVQKYSGMTTDFLSNLTTILAQTKG
jgi:hypothetical protein